MDVIKVDMLGGFSASAAGEPVAFGFGKVEALFIYLVFRKSATRNELAGVLWGSKDDATAKKNLRNALYELRKSFPGAEDAFIVERDSVRLSPRAEFDLDVDRFLAEPDNVDLYRGAFLDNLYVKDADEFESWVADTRESLRARYRERLSALIERAKARESWGEVERYARLLIKEDRLDESAYRELLRALSMEGRYNEGLGLYDELAEALDAELHVLPDEQTERALSELLRMMVPQKASSKRATFSYGRVRERRIVEDDCDALAGGTGARSLLIEGEMGVGKTWLKNVILEKLSDDGVYVVEKDCNQIDGARPLREWQVVARTLVAEASAERRALPPRLGQLLESCDPASEAFDARLEEIVSAMSEDALEHLVSESLAFLSERRKVALVFEDLHWMNRDSVLLLIRILLHIDPAQTLFVLTCRNESVRGLDLLRSFVRSNDNAEIVSLSRFTRAESEGLIHKARPGALLSSEELDRIYDETEGNAFFLMEYVDALGADKPFVVTASRMHDVIESKFLDLPDDERKVSEIASLFDGSAPFYVFGELLGRSPLQVSELVEKLEQRSILEKAPGTRQLSVRFTHRKLREFQYESLSGVKRNVLHDQVAHILERRADADPERIDAYYEIAYHYERANNPAKLLECKIRILSTNLDYSHERFPIIRYEGKIYDQFDYDDERASKRVEELEALLAQVKEEPVDDADIPSLEMAVLYIRGRYLIRKGDYAPGLACINRMMEIARRLDSVPRLIEGCRQAILYCLQTQSLDMMEQYVGYGHRLAQRSGVPEDEGEFKRYEALLDIARGDLDSAERLIDECIRIFSDPTRDSGRFVLYRAACYDEKGNIMRLRGDLPRALESYRQAIELCEARGIWISVSLFLTHAGMTAYEMGLHEEARSYLEHALSVYARIKYNAGEAVADAYMVLVLIDEGKHVRAHGYLVAADKCAGQLMNPAEVDTVERIKREIGKRAQKDPALFAAFEDYLS